MTGDVVTREPSHSKARKRKRTTVPTVQRDRNDLTHEEVTEQIFDEWANQKRPGVFTRLRRRRQVHKISRRMNALRAQATSERGGKTYTRAEIEALVRTAKGKAPI